ncbi:TPA: HrgA protein [Acinetobacter nosocomialis]|uniref:HrgA protein n=1 Tax=Acinetobacter nosocomialis TaxID=106654 RepID=A0A2L1VCV7_ACINO|nr:HrgA protein [Acinetobacter nosocomialis]AVF42927.1 HrgA protein [Acinetobacter nosocomialis]MBM9550858.1 HrgA protein [Acinetobacter nosocomialis]MBP1470795.1 HrgA protein [Acinetobacter nosocomialis]MBP1499664.1 HrgA protein [Acinetobacter nosocomialis]MBR7685705.1 HrgA protein [Acinetobacter nosocomialis]
MSKLSQTQKVAEFLKTYPNKKFNAREIAEFIIQKYPEDYDQKRKNNRFESEAEFLQQIVREISSGAKTNILKVSPHIHIQDQPRPRQFWFDPHTIYEVDHNINSDISESLLDSLEPEINLPIIKSGNLSEHDLYPILTEFLKSELNLYCLRIDEKRSKNSRGQNGNQWLHPDIVAMQPLDKHWNELVKSCVKHSSGQNVRLWSFEVKKELNSSNIRSSFFQAVSNSSWANEGYLVATSISTSDVEDELRMLSALHGIGVILLTPENPTESEILLPARRRTEVDWQSINRIVNENADFKNFIELVSIYYQTGRIRTQDWNH